MPLDLRFCPIFFLNEHVGVEGFHKVRTLSILGVPLSTYVVDLEFLGSYWSHASLSSFFPSFDLKMEETCMSIKHQLYVPFDVRKLS